MPADDAAGPAAEAALPAPPPRREPGREPVPAPSVTRLDGGLPVILQPSGLSSSVQLRVVYVPAAIAGGSADSPATGYSSRAWDLRPDDLPAAIEAAAAFEATPLLTQPLSPVPALRLEQEFARLTSPPGSTPGAPSPVLVAVAGRMEVDDVRRQLAEAFGKIHPQAVKHLAVALPRDAIAIRLGTPVAQAQWGYIAAAPGPGEAAADAWRLLLYILSHDYEGRLGRKAISEAGLAYYTRIGAPRPRARPAIARPSEASDSFPRPNPGVRRPGSA
jgi:hypothetical protein